MLSTVLPSSPVCRDMAVRALARLATSSAVPVPARLLWPAWNRVLPSAIFGLDVKMLQTTSDSRVAAEVPKSDGTRVIGVMVGNKSTDTGKVNQLKRVVGELEYSPALNNAGTASLFKGQFSELGSILRSIMIAECGGTLTVQKRIDTGSGLVKPATGIWTMSASGLGDRDLNVEETSSVTFDYGFGAGETSKTVQVTEAGAGFVYDRTECTANGVSVPVGPPEVAGTAGFSVELRPDKAVSCLMISRP